MSWLFGLLGGLIGYIFVLKGKVNVSTDNTENVKPLDQKIDNNNATISANNQELQQQEKQVNNESLQDLQSFFNRNLKQ